MVDNSLFHPLVPVYECRACQCYALLIFVITIIVICIIIIVINKNCKIFLN